MWQLLLWRLTLTGQEGMVYNFSMSTDERHKVTWEHRQAELWDRIFQVTQDVATLVDTFKPERAGDVIKVELVKTAMAVGTELVRANAAEDALSFRKHLTQARLYAIETDYWLRMSYVLQQQENVQQDLSSIISQYASIIDLLLKFSRHTEQEPHVIARHTKGPRIN